MTRKETELLVKDLGCRLTCEVVCRCESDGESFDGTLTQINATKSGELIHLRASDPWKSGWKRIWDVKPYLRPMSSMTKRERKALQDTEKFWANENGVIYNDEIVLVGDYFDMDDDDCTEEHHTARVYMEDWCWLMDWLHSHHFDHRGLIEKGLALTAPKGMYNIKA
jgi:hypothetical protein